LLFLAAAVALGSGGGGGGGVSAFQQGAKMCPAECCDQANVMIEYGHGHLLLALICHGF
jgi:hypothetical protein